jgi:hypothetical protein
MAVTPTILEKIVMMTSKDVFILLKNSKIQLSKGRIEAQAVIGACIVKLKKSAETKTYTGPLRLDLEKLEDFYFSLSSEFDLSKNKYKHGVKVGGSMMRGEVAEDHYISYCGL